MTINNNIQSINQKSLESGITASDPLEENPFWLQEFHVKTIGPLTKNDQYIEDSSIGRYLGYNSNPPPLNLPNIKFRIYAVDNPGWSLKFNDETRQIPNIISHQLPIDIEEETDRIIEDSYPEELETESLFINSRSDSYYSFSSALYLNLAIKLLKSCIDNGKLPIAGSLTSMRNQFKQNNPYTYLV